MIGASKKLLMGAAGAGGGDTAWISYEDVSNYQAAEGVAVDSSDNIVIAVWDAYTSMMVVKYDTDGTVLWNKTVASMEAVRDIAVDGSDNIIAIGVSRFPDFGNFNTMVQKYNSSGTLQWQKDLKRSGQDTQAYGVDADSSNNIYIAGLTATEGGIFVTKLNASGVEQWTTVLDGSDTQEGMDVAVDSSGNVYVTGYSKLRAGAFDLYLSKLTSAGSVSWQRILQDSREQIGYAIAVDSSDDVIVAGLDWTSASVSKYNSSGTLQWQRKITSTLGDVRWSAVALDASDNIFLSGKTPEDILVGKCSPSGVKDWVNYFDSSNSGKYGTGVAVTSTGYPVISAVAKNSSNKTISMVAKLPPDGAGAATYGPLVYGTANATDESNDLTSQSQSLSASAPTYTLGTTTFTTGTKTLSPDFYTITT